MFIEQLVKSIWKVRIHFEQKRLIFTENPPQFHISGDPTADQRIHRYYCDYSTSTSISILFVHEQQHSTEESHTK